MMSGTTVVVTLMYKNMIICANAGDSRAVMFSSSTDGFRHTPLSRDHKPEDTDEAARIRACNGRVEQSKIMPGMQLFGVNGKPVNNLAG
jgi:serine/threonine protein phosphatase PrpC